MGYNLIDGNCTLATTTQTAKFLPSYTPITIQLDPNCQTYQENSTICSVCANRYYFDPAKALCRQVDTSCQTWDKANGFCTSCYPGYTSGPNERNCKPIPPPSPNSFGPISPRSNCARWAGNTCTACAFRTFLNNGLCLPVSDQCNTFNPKFGFCLSCYSGYQLNNGDCEKI